jgi:hypothetical protein
MRNDFTRQLQQLLYSIGEVEGMITKDEAADLMHEVHGILSNGKNGEAGEEAVTVRRGLHLDAAHALRKFMNFVSSHESQMDKKLIAAFRAVADHLTQYYAVTSKKEKDLLAELKKKAGLMHHDHRKAG